MSDQDLRSRSEIGMGWERCEAVGFSVFCLFQETDDGEVGAVRNASARFASRGGCVLGVHGGGSVHARWRGMGRRSALRIAQGRPVNANRVALMAQATEERVDEGFVAEKRLPLGIV